MFSNDPDIRRLMALRAIESGLLRLKWLAAATRFEIAMRRHDRALKYALKYNPDQPRVPRGNPDGGQWTSADSQSDNPPNKERLEQGFITASDQPLRVDLGDLEEIANDSVIRTSIEDAWNSSNPFGNSPQERGFWICKDTETGQLVTRPFENSGTNKNIVPGKVPNDAIAFFHTHPNMSTSDNPFFAGPSFGDIKFANSIGLPGIIRSHNGVYYLGPPLNVPASR